MEKPEKPVLPSIEDAFGKIGLEKSVLPENVSKIFRWTDGGPPGLVEKVFADHTSKPRRSYRTGEFYRQLTDEDGPPTDDDEDISVTDPATFTVHRYRRVTDIASLAGCWIPRPFKDPLEAKDE